MVRLRHKYADLQAAIDKIQNKEAENERLIGIGEILDKLQTIVQRPCILQPNALYSHMQVIFPRAKPYNLALIIPISVAAFLVIIGIGMAKEPTNNGILRSVQNATPSDNTIKKIVRRAQQHCYKYVATKLQSGMLLELTFDRG